MIPFLILLFGFFFSLCFPDSLISTKVFHLPKQQKIKIVVRSAQRVSFLTMIQWQLPTSDGASSTVRNAVGSVRRV